MTGRRPRIAWISLIGFVILLGLGSRRFGAHLPDFLAAYAGDALWALAAFLGLGLATDANADARRPDRRAPRARGGRGLGGASASAWAWARWPVRGYLLNLQGLNIARPGPGGQGGRRWTPPRARAAE